MDNEFSPDRSTVGPPLIRDGLKDMQKIFELEAEKTDLLSAGEALLAWARRELMWQPIKTIPIGPEARFQILYACSYCGDAWSYNGKVWVADEDGCDEQVDLDEISHWRPILDTEPGKLPDPLEAFAEALKRVRGE